MHHRNLIDRKSRLDASYWRPRTAIALMIFTGIGGLLLIYEQRIHLLTGTTFLIACSLSA